MAHPDKINLDIHWNIMIHTIGPICSAVKFKLAVFTVPAKALACPVTCDPCQPTKYQGY